MKRKSEAGQAIIFVAFGLTALMGFAGLGLDMGVMRLEKRVQQSAADAAAIAGANNLAYPASGGVTAGAQNASQRNGFTDNGGGNVSACTTSAAINTICVQVNNPPASGPHSGNAKYVEVLVADVHTTYFMKVLGIPKTVITARAVATNLSGGDNSGCLYTLGPPSSSIEGVNINGNATLNATTCGIVDNGNFNTKGNALDVNAGTFGIAGSWDKSGPGGTVTCSGTSGACPAPNMPASGDPLTALTPPCSPCTGGSAASAKGGVFSPGTYSSISVGPGQSTFNPGLYIIDGSGGLSIGANATVTGNGVTFYFTNGATVNMTGTPDVQFTAPGASGQYPGVLYYQDPNDTAGPSIGGDASTNYNGIMYFPKAQVTFYGNSSIGDIAVVIADSLALSGHPTVNLEGVAGLPAGVGTLSNAVLVE